MSPDVLSRIPDHVSMDQVIDYDYLDDPRITEDVQLGMHSLHDDAPDIFFSPRNGGFWVVTRYDLMEKVLRDSEHFSNRMVEVPKSQTPYVMIPLNLDPPDHLPFRMAVMRHFDQKKIRSLEPFLREWANRLIDRVIDRGTCEFAEEVAAAFPVSVFMELMGMPLERFEEFRGIVHEFFNFETAERRIEVQGLIVSTMAELFEEKRRNPQDDLMSKLLEEEVRGRKLTTDEINSIGFLLFLAGLDTVANTLSFTFRYLARDPDLQDRLRADSSIVPAFVEESLRRFSIVNQPREVKKDYDFHGAKFRAGDMVVCPLALAGMDERRNPEPETVDVDRRNRAHLAFSTGPHICIGNFLARTEMRILTEEWLKRIPRFRLDPDEQVRWRSGGVMALENLHFRWDPPATGRQQGD